MSVLCPASRGARPQLGSPAIPINPPARYLRHRLAAERAHRNRRQAARRRQLVVLVCMGLLYLAIGRELLQLTRAKMSLASTEMRSDSQTLALSLKRILRPKADAGQPPAAPDNSEAAPSDISSLFDEQ